MKKNIREQVIAAISVQPMTARQVAEHIGANSGSVGGVLSKLNKEHKVIMSYPDGEDKAGYYSLPPYTPQVDALADLDAKLPQVPQSDEIEEEEDRGETEPTKKYKTTWYKWHKSWTAYLMKHPEIAAEFVYQVTYYMDYGRFDNPHQSAMYLEFVQPELDANIEEIKAKSNGGKNKGKKQR